MILSLAIPKASTEGAGVQGQRIEQEVREMGLRAGSCAAALLGSWRAAAFPFPFGGLQSDYRKQGATQTPQQKCRLRILNGSKPRATAWQGSAGMQESCKDNPCEAQWQAALPCGQRRLG